MRWMFLFSLFAAAFMMFLPIGRRWNGALAIRIRTWRYLQQNKSKAAKSGLKNDRQTLLERKMWSALQHKLAAASIPLTPKEFVSILSGAGAILLLLAFVWGLLPSLAVAAALYGLVFVLLKQLPERRKRKMAAQLGDALLLISSALKSGYSIVQAIDLVARENMQPLSEQFQTLTQSLKLGEPFEKALSDFGKRLDIEELTLVVDTILITRETGGNVTQVIDELMEVMRENEKLAEEVKAVSAQGRMSAWVIGMLPLFLFFFLFAISPDYMSALVNNVIGIILLAVAAGSQAIGIFIIRKMINFKIR